MSLKNIVMKANRARLIVIVSALPSVGSVIGPKWRPISKSDSSMANRLVRILAAKMPDLMVGFQDSLWISQIIWETRKRPKDMR